ncbi:MAG TPA: FkbM family methyltransferase [Pseudobacteroides sp.]|uniref:FkbM family methyltransferase n=1 Tax=Pseudobacteroides sp. TaxID=1968840 RepID=UPI002F92FA33
MDNPCTCAEKVLPNGTVVSSFPGVGGEWEVPSQFQHVLEYFRHGIDVSEASVVLDIGANIGLFALTVYDRCKGNVCVHSFEPIPPTFDDLEKNFSCYDTNKLKAYPFGISNKTGTLSFTHYPNAPGLSTHYPEYMKVGLEQMLNNIESNAEALPEFFVNANKQEITEDKDKSRFNKMRAVLGLKTVFQELHVQCQVKTLSDFMKENTIEKIDLLKVDVNGSEMDVFEGIEDRDWQKIRQVVTEVPLGGERLEILKDLLHKKGFTSVIAEEQAPVVNKGLAYFIVYAKK